MDSNLSSAPSAPNLILSKKERQSTFNKNYPGKGIGSDYVDTYNQSLLGQYNNEYNYWLWQQQMEYNSPINQVARLKEAGLNPNYNSIDGTGNASSIPSSSMSISGNAGSNSNARVANNIKMMQAITQGVSSIVDNVQKGVSTLSAYSELPPIESMKQYKQIISDLQRNKGEQSTQILLSSVFDNIMKSYYTGSDLTFQGAIPYSSRLLGDVNSSPYAQSIQSKINLQEAQKALAVITANVKEFQLGNVEPAKLANIQKQFEILGFSASQAKAVSEMATNESTFWIFDKILSVLSQVIHLSQGAASLF